MSAGSHTRPRSVRSLAPNTAGIVLHANGGRSTSKPYAASGAYIQRMSNYCAGCGYRPQQRARPRARPITVLYWSFLMRHQSALSANPRASLMVKNLQRFDSAECPAIRREAQRTIERIETL